MKKTLWLVALAIILSTVAIATEPPVGSHPVPFLDGTSWTVTVEPDANTKALGEKDFTETLTFADGEVKLSAPKVGVFAAPYTASKTGEKDCTFEAKRLTAAEGSAVWTGAVHGNSVEGRMVWTKTDGVVYTYTFKGSKLH